MPSSPPPATRRGDDFLDRAGRPGASRYLSAVRSRWLVIAALVIAALVGAGAYIALAPKQYEAGANVLVTPVAEQDPAYVGVDVLRDSGTQGSTVVTAATLVTTPRVIEAAAAQLRMPSGEVKAAVTATPLVQSDIVSVVAQAGSAEQAARIANAVARATVHARTQLYENSVATGAGTLRARLATVQSLPHSGAEAAAIQQRLAGLASLPVSDPSIHVLSQAIPPAGPSWPRPRLILAAAFTVALLAGVALAIVLEFLSQRVTQEQQLVLEHRLPVLARIPIVRGSRVSRFMTGRDPLPVELSESYRTLRAVLAGTDPGGGLGTVLVSSAGPGEAKTMTAVALAMSVAESGHRAILVDGDLRQPMLASTFGVAANSTTVVAAPRFGDRLGILPSLPPEARPGGAVDGAALRHVLASLRRRADAVIVDAGPVADVADTLELATAVDTVLLTVWLGTTRRDALEDARRLLSLRGVTPAGLVVVSRVRHRSYGKPDELPRVSGLRPVRAVGPDGAPEDGHGLRGIVPSPRAEGRAGRGG